jgi:DNA-binding NarL/FixJ family response regulator
MINHKKIRVALIGSHQLRILALLSLLQYAKEEIEVTHTLQFDSESLNEVTEASQMADILILDGLDYATDLLSHLQELGENKVILISETDDRNLMDQWVLLGVRGILGSDTTTEQFIKAILKVSAGELWLDRFTTSRIVSEISNKKRNVGINDDTQLMARLTEREIGILRAILAGEGQALRDIAETLFISEYTLRNHLTSIYSKLGVRNRLDLYVFARARFGSGQQK